MRVTEGNTDLGWGQALAGELDDLVDDFFVGGLGQPRRGSATVGESGGR
jgi:hypothetical protein